MSASSLAIVFAPCILRSPDADDPFLGMKDVSKTTMWVITLYTSLTLHFFDSKYILLYTFCCNSPVSKYAVYTVCMDIDIVFMYVYIKHWPCCLQVCGDPDLWAVQALHREDAEYPEAGICRSLGCQSAQTEETKHGEVHYWMRSWRKMHQERKPESSRICHYSEKFVNLAGILQECIMHQDSTHHARGKGH